MTRLDILKKERQIIKNLNCLSYQLKEDCDKWYAHEIECIEKWHSANPEYGDVNG